MVERERERERDGMRARKRGVRKNNWRNFAVFLGTA